MKTRTYRHVLVATDGSRLAAKAVRAAVKLARALDARVRGLYVAPTHAAILYGSAGMHAAPVVVEHFDADKRAHGKKALAAVQEAARRAGVPCSVETVEDDQPGKAIVQVARRRGCDLVVLASHGRSALGRLLLGSSTGHVLAKSKVPVLVVR